MTHTSDNQPPSVPQGTSVPKGPTATDASKAFADQPKEAAAPWYRSPTVIIATLALTVSIVSSVATILNNRSNTQNQNQQQLLSQFPSQLATLQQTYGKNPAQLLNLSAP